MKRHAALALGVVLAATLTGCSAITAVGEQTGIDLALTGLVSSLESDHGVTAVTTKNMDADYRFSVTVTIEALPVDKRADVITAVDEVLGGSAFGSASANLWIGPGDYPVFSQSVFGEDTLARDLEYWSAVEEAVGPVSFGIYEDPDGDGPRTRTRGVSLPTAMDYSALVGIELDPTALDSWGSLGVSAVGTLPGSEAANALAVVSADIPLRDYADPGQPIGLSLDWTEPDAAQWTVTSGSLPDDASNPTASTDWPAVVDAAGKIAASGIRNSHFAYFSDFGAGGVVFFGDCMVDLAVGPVDADLFDGLVAAGVAMPAGSAPGWCSGG